MKMPKLLIAAGFVLAAVGLVGGFGILLIGVLSEPIPFASAQPRATEPPKPGVDSPQQKAREDEAKRFEELIDKLKAEIQAYERGKSGIAFEAVLEKIDGNAITIRAYHHVIPPSGQAGGAIHSGQHPRDANAARFENLPVMPEGMIVAKKLRPGARMDVTLDTIRGGALVVTALKERTDPERIGIDWIDAPKPKR